jgi:hypothetical protein
MTIVTPYLLKTSRNPLTGNTTTKSGSQQQRQKSIKKSTTTSVTRPLKSKRDRDKGHRVTRKPATILAPTSHPTTTPPIATSINMVFEAIRVEVEEATAIVEAVVVVEALVVPGALVDKPICQLQPTAAIGPTTSRTHKVTNPMITATKTVTISGETTTSKTTPAEMTVETRHITPTTHNPLISGRIRSKLLALISSETITAITNTLTLIRTVIRERVTPMIDQYVK